jgi:DNA-binding transcriptional MerR regulator
VLKIGTFARRAAVSVKTLRFYDNEGVFRATRVDPRSGYRYYDSSQLLTFRQLQLLRAVGCSICDLKIWMAAPEGSERRCILLMSLRDRLRSRMAADLGRLDLLDGWIRADAHLAVQCAQPIERALVPMPALTIRDRVRSIDPAVYKMFESAERSVARHAARAALSPLLLFHSQCHRAKNADVEVCVPILPAAVGVIGGRIIEGADRAA